MRVPGVTIRKLEDVASLVAFDEQLEVELNTLWCGGGRLINRDKNALFGCYFFVFGLFTLRRLLIGAILVFFMQTGFAMVEVGSVGSKNTRSILLKVCAFREGG